MKVIINNHSFPYDIGCRILKLKYENPPFPELNDIWDDIIPFTFNEIAQLDNIESRRVAIDCLGIERLVKEIKPKLVNSKTINKTTTWVNRNGELETKKFKDTYELYEVDKEYFNNGLSGRSWQKMRENVYFVKCKDTSTDREYFIWVDIINVFATNHDRLANFDIKKVNAIQAIAWTIQTNLSVGNIEKIIRQGDCILLKPINKEKGNNNLRHLTEKEYLNLITAES